MHASKKEQKISRKILKFHGIKVVLAIKYKIKCIFKSRENKHFLK